MKYCPECGQKKAHPVGGEVAEAMEFGTDSVEYECPNCGCRFVIFANEEEVLEDEDEDEEGEEDDESKEDEQF